MRKRTLVFILLFVTVAFIIDVPDTCWAESETADKTQVNQPAQEFTADQQAETKSDREITAKIRRAIIDDKSLSINANNLEIITVRGMVTLRGPVSSEEDKNAIEETAAGIAGKTNVKNEIGIASKKTDTK